jgi:hypothetical protein
MTNFKDPLSNPVFFANQRKIKKFAKDFGEHYERNINFNFNTSESREAAVKYIKKYGICDMCGYDDKATMTIVGKMIHLRVLYFKFHSKQESNYRVASIAKNILTVMGKFL